MNPITETYIERFSRMATERVETLIGKLPKSRYGKIVEFFKFSAREAFYIGARSDGFEVSEGSQIYFGADVYVPEKDLQSDVRKAVKIAKQLAAHNNSSVRFLPDVFKFWQPSTHK